jgi:PAS domain-containing protein
MSSVTGDLGMASHFALPYHGQSKHIERAFGFVAQEFDKSFESYLGSNTSDRHDESRLYTGSFDGAPMRPVEELPTIEETRALFTKFAEWYNTKHHHTGQGMDGKTPETVFNENLRGRRDIPADWAQYVWTRREVKIVQRNGVTDGGISYYNPAMREITGREVELRVSIDDIGTAYIFNLEGEYLYDAVSEFRDSGVTEENARNVRRLNKKAHKIIDEYQGVIKEIRKDRKTQLEEQRDGIYNGPGSVKDGTRAVNRRPGADAHALLETREVSGGEPLGVIKRRLRLPTDPD